MPLLYHAYVYLEFLILACTIYILAPREAYHLQYAGFKPDDYNHKDLMINSSLLGVDGTAEYLATLIKKKFCL